VRRIFLKYAQCHEMWNIEIINIAMPNSTCQNRILKGNGTIKPKFIIKINKIPNIPDIKKIMRSKMFQILL